MLLGHRKALVFIILGNFCLEFVIDSIISISVESSDGCHFFFEKKAGALPNHTNRSHKHISIGRILGPGY